MPKITVSGQFFKTFRNELDWFVLSSGQLASIPLNGYRETWSLLTDIDMTDGCACGNLLYLSSSSGVYMVDQPYVYSGEDMASYLYSYPRRSGHGRVNCIDCNQHSIVIGESGGVIRYDSYGPVGAFTLQPVTTVKMDAVGNLYYAGEFGLGVKKAPITENWSQPTYSVSVSGSPYFLTNNVTAIDTLPLASGFNLVAVATSSGCYIYEEGLEGAVEDKFLSFFVSGITPSGIGINSQVTLSGGSNQFSSVELATGSTLESGSFLLGGEDGFQAVDLASREVLKYYTHPELVSNVILDFS